MIWDVDYGEFFTLVLLLVLLLLVIVVSIVILARLRAFRQLREDADNILETLQEIDDRSDARKADIDARLTAIGNRLDKVEASLKMVKDFSAKSGKVLLKLTEKNQSESQSKT